jgi:hypothetical protein
MTMLFQWMERWVKEIFAIRLREAELDWLLRQWQEEEKDHRVEEEGLMANLQETDLSLFQRIAVLKGHLLLLEEMVRQGLISWRKNYFPRI